MPDTKTILVADDETDIREALVAILEAENFQVLEAANGQAALDTTLQSKPDLVLLDIQMPGLTGIEVLREMRSDEHHQNTPVIMLTAQSDMDHISEAIELGGVNFEYLTKTDWKLSDVVAKVKARLEL